MFIYTSELIIVLIIYLSGMVALAQYKQDTSIANFTWGGGVMLVALYTFFRLSNFLIQQILITTMIMAWALRLIMYIYVRYTGHDPRFSSWKFTGMKALLINMIWVFGQIVMITIMSYPVFLINTYNNPHALSFFDIGGFVVWLFGYSFEAISDQQLFHFMRNSNNKGHVMRFGLWRYSRHPNYFGETVLWWGIYCFTLSVPYGWMAIITPVTITTLLLFVTGIPWIEKAMAHNPEYQEYTKKTSIFIPWFTKNTN
ncbi:MAG TPA: DUF1295 domain-containing protein [Candidatus Babeliales bacterium]|jgi:steroid 5-alpha reductase family enzyme|nr:DUF1295 domain-containing protein [Candidatus Babeliales bacterium]